jgi:NAD(P)-dependent dehydrogenase (short-subunit alcohol dehydrogenase family)
MTCDLAKEKDCDEVVNNTVAHFKKLDVLVANAGILAANPLETMPMEEYDRMMNINCINFKFILFYSKY